MISLVITNYNRVEMVIESCIQVIDNDLISEIIIMDDFSDVHLYIKLWNAIQDLNTDKVKLYRRTKNLGPLLNKYEAVKKSSNEWGILLDSDNIIDNDYVKKVVELEKESDMLYCPEILWEGVNKKKAKWNYEKFRGLIIDKTNAKDYIETDSFLTWLNTGNYFFNRDIYLGVVEKSTIRSGLIYNDAIYFSYLWLMGGNRMQIVPELAYIHRAHEGSWYKKNRSLCNKNTETIKEKLKTA